MSRCFRIWLVLPTRGDHHARGERVAVLEHHPTRRQLDHPSAPQDAAAASFLYARGQPGPCQAGVRSQR